VSRPAPRRVVSPALGVLVAALTLGGCAAATQEPTGDAATTRQGTGGEATSGEASGDAPDELPVPETSLDVRAVYPRPEGFTQGLEILDDGRLLHSRGLFGQSQVEVFGLGETEAEVSRDLPDEHFGEGVTVLGDGTTAYQLTWQSGVVHTWSLPDLEEGTDLAIPGQGWGLCHDASRDVLWLSDGSATLQALDPADLAVQEVVQVQDGGTPVTQLNELECVDGQVWANIWHSDEVVRIDPATGDVAQRVELSELTAEVAPQDPEHVLNGLAYDKADGTFLVTGKEWDRIFRVDLAQD
jgi:glutaminyl-peptide cyclotransferase